MKINATEIAASDKLIYGYIAHMPVDLARTRQAHNYLPGKQWCHVTLRPQRPFNCTCDANSILFVFAFARNLSHFTARAHCIPSGEGSRRRETDESNLLLTSFAHPCRAGRNDGELV